MTKKIMILLCLLVFCTGLFPLDSVSSAAEEKAGLALLDSLYVTFKDLAEKKNSVMDKTQRALVDIMKETQSARAQGQIDQSFFNRFHRIIQVLYMLTSPPDDGGILAPLYFGEINRFIEDVEGIKIDVQTAGSNVAINTFSKAVSHEVVNLRLYLESREDREKLMGQYAKDLNLPKDPAQFTELDNQKASMKDIAVLNVVLQDYMTDHGHPPPQNGIYTKDDNFAKALSPFYIKIVPVKDKWDNNFYIYTGKSCNGVFPGIKSSSEKDVLILSYGQDGKIDNWKYNPKKEEAGLYPISEKNIKNDLVIWNGKWIRGPKLK
ncbi:hypothetical protein ACFLT9_04465 [Acidobacteriota bacterium]